MSEPTRTRGLGRGLSALLGEPDAERDEAGPEIEALGARGVPIELIQPNPAQPRRRFDPDELSDLARSIKEKGVLQPLLVRPAGDGSFQIVAGERRWRAAQKAGLHEAPVVIRELSDEETLEIAIIENVQRADLSPMEEAEAYQRLMDQFDRTQSDVAGIVGKSRAHIANTLRLLSLPETVRELVETGQLSAGHARTLIPAEDPAGLARRAIDDGLSVRALEALVRKGPPRPRKAGSAGPDKDADTLALESDIAESLGLTVDLRHKGESGGELRLSYSSLEQLDDLVRRLTG